MGRMEKKVTLESLAESIDTLAAITKKGFDETATKGDIAAVRTEMATGLRDVEERLVEKLASKEDLNHFARSWAGEIIETKERIKKVEDRVDALEVQKAG